MSLVEGIGTKPNFYNKRVDLSNFDGSPQLTASTEASVTSSSGVDSIRVGNFLSDTSTNVMVIGTSATPQTIQIPNVESRTSIQVKQLTTNSFGYGFVWFTVSRRSGTGITISLLSSEAKGLTAAIGFSDSSISISSDVKRPTNFIEASTASIVSIESTANRLADKYVETSTSLYVTSQTAYFVTRRFNITSTSSIVVGGNIVLPSLATDTSFSFGYFNYSRKRKLLFNSSVQAFIDAGFIVNATSDKTLWSTQTNNALLSVMSSVESDGGLVVDYAKVSGIGPSLGFYLSVGIVQGTGVPTTRVYVLLEDINQVTKRVLYYDSQSDVGWTISHTDSTIFDVQNGLITYDNLYEATTTTTDLEAVTWLNTYLAPGSSLDPVVLFDTLLGSATQDNRKVRTVAAVTNVIVERQSNGDGTLTFIPTSNPITRSVFSINSLTDTISLNAVANSTTLNINTNPLYFDSSQLYINNLSLMHGGVALALITYTNSSFSTNAYVASVVAVPSPPLAVDSLLNTVLFTSTVDSILDKYPVTTDESITLIAV